MPAMRDTETDFQRRVILALRVVVVAAMLGGAWWFFATLPPDEAVVSENNSQLTTLRVSLLEADREDAAKESSESTVSLYPVDIVAIQREFLTERRPGVPFDDFMTRRMAGRAPVEARFDERGRAMIEVPAGRWWVYATKRRGAEEVMWRLPVNVRGREQDVNLTPQNAYMRTRDF